MKLFALSFLVNSALRFANFCLFIIIVRLFCPENAPIELPADEATSTSGYCSRELKRNSEMCYC